LSCLNEGKCVEDGEDVRCECAAGFDGEDCEINLDDCPRNACLNGGTCVDGIESYSCRCTPAFTGKECETLRFEWVTPLDSSVTVQGISGDGRVVVGHVVADGTAPAKPFRWTSADGLRHLGAINGTATAANFDGTVVVGWIDGFDGFGAEAFRWTQQDGPVPLGGNDSYAMAVSYDGNTVVGTADTSALNVVQAFRWSSGRYSELGSMLEGGSSSPVAISGDGTVFIGNAGYPGPTSKPGAAFRFAVNAFIRIGTEENRAYVYDISGDGSVIVGTYIDAALNNRTFRWTAIDGLMDLPLGDLTSTSARVVNSDGSVIAGAAYSLSTLGWVWRATTGVQPIADLIADTGTDVTGLAQIEPRGISADGSVLVGTLFYAESGFRSWVLRLEAN
jgi:uncharacterized membrane protein